MVSSHRSQGKDRITITLRKDILPLVDNFIDGEKIRNRSHAIEYILGQHLGLGIQTAVLFAGADQKNIVHALTRVRNRPIIAYIFELLKSHGIRNVVIVVDKYGVALQEYLGDGIQWGMKIAYVESPEGKGTARALALVESYIQKTFLLIYADVLVDLNLSDFVEHHQHSSAVATVALTYKRSPEEYGVARLEGHKIVEYSEKPGKEGRHGLVNAGIYLLEPEIFEYLKEHPRSLEKEVLPLVAANGQLAGYPFQGKWFDISKNSGKQKAEKEWR